MPYYDYYCTSCENEFEKNMLIRDRKKPTEEPCPKCSESTVIQKLRKALGNERYNSIFGSDGALEGYDQIGNTSLNDSDIDESTLQKILDQIVKDEISIQSVEIEN